MPTTSSTSVAYSDAVPSNIWQTTGTSFYSIDDLLTVAVDRSEKGISPQLYFKYVKSKLKTIERFKLDRRLAKIEAAFMKAAENGQTMMAQKILNGLSRLTRESLMYAKGLKFYIEADVLSKHKRNIRGGHISDTPLEEFTRVIPEDVLEKKKAVEGLFDSFVIYHYWNEKAVDAKEMAPEEKAKMRDPILFGRIKESNCLYFIADWEDEFCTLTFDEIIDVVGEEETGQLTSKIDDSVLYE